MKSASHLRESLRTALLGQAGFSAAFDMPLQSPQLEVAVWLYGLGEPRDVTDCHSVACPMPCIFCIPSSGDEPEKALDRQRLSLHFIERTLDRRLLGEIELQYHATVATSGPQLRLYRAIDCVTSCLPRYRRWMRSLYFARERWKARGSEHSRMSSLDTYCNEIIFFCPRPVVLVSLCLGETGNIFPMNLMGPMGDDHFVFALNHSKKTAATVLASSELAVSTIPFEHAEVVRKLGPNHNRTSVDFRSLPFCTSPSRNLSIPVPEFALAVRECRIEKMLSLGSHDFFVARIICRQIHANAPEFYRIHGLYASRRK